MQYQVCFCKFDKSEDITFEYNDVVDSMSPSDNELLKLLNETFRQVKDDSLRTAGLIDFDISKNGIIVHEGKYFTGEMTVQRPE